MLSVPQLSTEAIRETLVNELRRQRERQHPPRPLLAVYGTGASDLIRDAEFGELSIVPVRSELDLRAKLPSLEEPSVPTAYLVPWRADLPADIAVRFAQRGRVVPIGPGQRLQVLTGTRVEDLTLAQSKLAAYLLRPNNPRTSYPAPGGQLTEDALWAAWLKLDWGLESSGGLSRDLLLAWVAQSGHGPRFAKALLEPAADGLRDELERHLEKRVGPVGPLALRCWEQGRGEDLLALGVLCEAFQESGALDQKGVNIWLNAEFKHRFNVSKEQVPEIAQALAETTPLVLRLLDREGEGSADNARELLSRRAVARADQWVATDDDIAAAASGSRRLPCAWRARQARLGEALAAGAQNPSAAAVKLAVERQRELERHDAFKLADDTLAVRRGEMAVRLLAWLSQGIERFAPRGMAAHSDAELLAQWYVDEGGYVDWARRWARGSSDDALGRGVQAVLERVDPIRRDLDERFSESLAAWHEASRPGQHVVPIDRAIEKLAVPFLEQTPDGEAPRKLLVLLMDGMAWAQAVELLQSMAELHPVPWSPLAWHTLGKNRIGAAHYPPVLANLPTVTEVSRAAFFAGKPMAPGSKLDTQNDSEHFAKHQKLQGFSATHKAPRLLLRAESHTRDGAASEEALSLIRDEERRIVGIVVNAIDASLKGDPQQLLEWRVSSIKSLADILEAARSCSRYVLLASDHGHVPADRLRHHSSPSPAGARWRPYRSAGDPVQAGERLYQGPGVYRGKDMHGAVLITTDTLRYGSGPYAGEHGGATLAEVVAPCFLLGWDDPISERGPADSRLVSAFVPDWWHYAAPVAAVSVTAPPTAPPPSRKKAPSEKQLGLPGVEAPKPPVAVAAEAPTDPFAECDMLVARVTQKGRRDMVARAVRFLVSRGNVAPAEAFAQHLNTPVFRVDGVVAILTEALNVDGYEVLRFERDNRQLFLDRAKLELQFGVKL